MIKYDVLQFSNNFFSSLRRRNDLSIESTLTDNNLRLSCPFDFSLICFHQFLKSSLFSLSHLESSIFTSKIVMKALKRVFHLKCVYAREMRRLVKRSSSASFSVVFGIYYTGYQVKFLNGTCLCVIDSMNLGNRQMITSCRDLPSNKQSRFVFVPRLFLSSSSNYCSLVFVDSRARSPSRLRA